MFATELSGQNLAYSQWYVNICYTRKQVFVRKASLEICIPTLCIHKRRDPQRHGGELARKGSTGWAGGTLGSASLHPPSPFRRLFHLYVRVYCQPPGVFFCLFQNKKNISGNFF